MTSPHTLQVVTEPTEASYTWPSSPTNAAATRNIVSTISTLVPLNNQTTMSSHKSLKLPQNLPKKHLPKIQRTDAPMLNHIFDSISSANKHHHHDHR